MKRLRTALAVSAALTALLATAASAQPSPNGTLPPAPPQGTPPNGMGGADGFGTVPDEQAPALTASLVVDAAASGTALGAQTLASAEADKSVLVVQDGASARAVKTVFAKTGGDTTNGGQSNFYGLNAAVVAQGAGTLSMQGVTVTTAADGANAVFATGEGSTVTIKGIKIRTTANSSRGLDATYGGTIVADKVDIETQGAHSAAFATDRGEGTVTVRGGTAKTAGEGSPVIYSTGDISVRNVTGTATGAEIAVIEGKNRIIIEKSTLTGGLNRARGNDVAAAVMLYQSMSGDAGQGTSVFAATDSTLTSTASGAFFYITNTSARINLTRTRLENVGDVLIQATGNESERGWGRRGANGSTLSLTARQQTLGGNIVVDAISAVSLDFGAGTRFTGAINAANAGTVNLTLAKKATLTLTADSYCNELVLEDTAFKNLKTGGHALFYNKDAGANSYLHGRTILLADGGKLVGITMNTTAAATTATVADVARADGNDAPSGAQPFGGRMRLQSITGVVSLSGDTVTLKVTALGTAPTRGNIAAGNGNAAAGGDFAWGSGNGGTNGNASARGDNGVANGNAAAGGDFVRDYGSSGASGNASARGGNGAANGNAAAGGDFAHGNGNGGTNGNASASGDFARGSGNGGTNGNASAQGGNGAANGNAAAGGDFAHGNGSSGASDSALAGGDSVQGSGNSGTSDSTLASTAAAGEIAIGSVYTLTVAPAPDGKGMANAAVPGTSGMNGARPPAPPSGGKPTPAGGKAPAGKNPPPSMNGRQPQKPVTLDDLKALAGKTATIRGRLSADGTITVFGAEEK